MGSFEGRRTYEMFYFFPTPKPIPALSQCPARKLFSVFPNQMKQSKLFLFLLHFKRNLPCFLLLQMYFYINKNLFGIFQKLLGKNLDSIMDCRFYFWSRRTTNIHIYFCFSISIYYILCGVCVVPYIVYTYSRAQETEAAGAAAQRPVGRGLYAGPAQELFGPQNAGTCKSAGALRERESQSATQRRESEAQQNKNSCRAIAVLTASRYSFILLAVRFVSRMREMRSCHQTATDAPSNFCIFNAKGFA